MAARALRLSGLVSGLRDGHEEMSIDVGDTMSWLWDREDGLWAVARVCDSVTMSPYA